MGCVASVPVAGTGDMPIKQAALIKSDSAISTNHKPRHLDNAPSKNSHFSDDSAENMSQSNSFKKGIDPNIHHNKPDNDVDRIAAVRALGVIGTPPDPRFDSITSLAKALFQTPLAAITLIDEEVVHIHSAAGDFPFRCAPRPGSFCNWLLLSLEPTMLIVEDGLTDARFAHNGHPAGPPNSRFYAGAPLIGSGGHLYGALCVVDAQPRKFKPEHYCLLGHLAEMAVAELERDVNRQKDSIQSTSAALSSISTCPTDGVVLLDVSRPQWPLLYTNSAWTEATEESAGHEAYSAGEALFWQQFRDRVVEPEHITDSLASAKNGEPFNLTILPKQAQNAVLQRSSSRRSNAGGALNRLDSCKEEFGGESMEIWFVPVARSNSSQLNLPNITAETARNGDVSKQRRVVCLPAGLTSDFSEGLDSPRTPLDREPRVPSGATTVSLDTASNNVPSTSSGRECSGLCDACGGLANLDIEKSSALADALTALSGVRISSVRSSIQSDEAAREIDSTLFNNGGGEGMGTVLKAATSIIKWVDKGRATVNADAADKLSPIYYIGIISASRNSAKSCKTAKTPLPLEEIPLEELVPSGAESTRDSAGSLEPGSVTDLDFANLGPQLQEDNDILGDCGSVITSGEDLSNEISLGPLIGSRSGAWCFRGHWKGGKVAVSVLERWAAGFPSSEETELDAVAANLHHPHIVQTFAHSVKDSRPMTSSGNTNTSSSSNGLVYRQVWLVQEFCARGTLLDSLEKGALKRPDGSPNMPAVLATAREVAAAMQYVHSKGLAHPYLSSSNVVLAPAASQGYDGRGWVAKVTSTQWDPVETSTCSSLQTAAAIAKAAQRGVQSGEARQASDVLAFGVVLWEMVSGRRAYLGSEEFYRKSEMMGLALEAPKNAPPAFAALMESCLAKMPEERPTFAAVCKALEQQMHRGKLAAPLSRVME